LSRKPTFQGAECRIRAVNGHETALLERTGYRLTPPSYVRKLDRLLSLAGRPASLPLGRVLAAKPLLGLLAALLGVWFASTPAPVLKLVGLFVVLLGYFIPDLLLYGKGQERQKLMQRELANTLDQMLIAVEAGPGFEGESYQADQHPGTAQLCPGGGAGRHLRHCDQPGAPDPGQSDARQAPPARRGKAMKLPVMIVFALLFFIFPVLFIAILGPAVINAIATFSGRWPAAGAHPLPASGPPTDRTKIAAGFPQDPPPPQGPVRRPSTVVPCLF
jgi:tight adherence protein C